MDKRLDCLRETKKLLGHIRRGQDDLREAVVQGLNFISREPYQDLIEECQAMKRQPFLSGFMRTFENKKLGGLTLERKDFPNSLSFANDDCVLILRRRFYKAAPLETPQPAPDGLLKVSRFVLFWDYPIPGEDVLKGFNIQMFENDGTPLEEATRLSKPIPILAPGSTITVDMFNPHLGQSRINIS